MKSNVVFYINEGAVKFLQVSTLQAKTAAVSDIINTAGQDDARISETLRAFIKNRKLNFAESRVTVLIPRSKVILRSMLFPSHKEEEIRSMIDLQIGGSIPYSREEVEIDFQILTRSPDGYAKAAVVIIPQETVMRYWKIFSDAKIPVHGITISSVGLWLLYRRQPGIPEAPSAIFDVGLNHSEICLCAKTHWLLSREIAVGSVQMKQDGYAGILKQWELTQHHTGSEKLTEPVESVYLAGTPELFQDLSSELVKTQNNLNVKEINAPMPSLAGIAYSTETPPINLIPGAVRQNQAQRAYQRQLITAGIWVAAALLSLGLALGMDFLKKNLQLARLNEQLGVTKEEALSVEEEWQKIHDIEYRIKNRLVFANLAHKIYRLLPPQVYLVSIAITEGNIISFQGVASNSVDINQFQKDMADSRQFSNVSLDYVNKRVTPQGEVDYFKITCTLKPMSGPA